MNRTKALFLFVIMCLSYSCQLSTAPEMIWAASPSIANVKAAVSMAKAGDTVMVPGGFAFWGTDYLTITKGISLIGAGISNTIITAVGGSVIQFSPDAAARQNQDMFRISGFTFRGSLSSHVIGLMEDNREAVPIRNVRIDHNRWENSAGYPILIDGNFWGVTDNNQFAGYNFIMIGGNEGTSWNEFYPATYGTADNLYFEDNTISGPYWFAIQSGQGGRWAFRHNTINSSAMGNPMFDQHGFQQFSTGVYGLMLCEIYENTVTGVNTGVARWDYQRGGKLLMYNNTGMSTEGIPGITQEDSRSDYTAPPPIYTPYESYFFNNLWNGHRVNCTKATDLYGTINENVSYWNQKDGFDGTVGIGIGPLSSRPATCTTGVAYWATDTKTLYRASAPDTWTVYYTPYAYPHPLRGR